MNPATNSVDSRVFASEPGPGDLNPHADGITGRTVWVGVVVMTAAVVAMACLAVDGRDRLVSPSDLQNPYWVGFTIYSIDHFVLAGALLLVGLGLVTARSATSKTAMAAVSGLCAAQLAGLGMVAFRTWPSFAGAVATIADWDLVQELAAVMAASCAVAAVASLIVVVRLRDRDRGALLVTVPLGLVVAVALPLMVPFDWADAADRIAVALQYGLPLGIALAVTGVLELRPALIVAAAVAASAFLMPLSRAFVDNHEGAAIILVVGCALVALLGRLPRSVAAPGRHRRDG